MACFKPAYPPTIPTPDTFLREIIATKCQIVFCVPIFVEVSVVFWELSLCLRTSGMGTLSRKHTHPSQFKCTSESPPRRNDAKMNILKVYAGAPMTRSIGDQLVAAGVNLIPFYGS